METWLAVPAEPGTWRLLLLRRSDEDGGFWQGVSGCVEAEDATLAQAALREIAEETGLLVPPEHLLDLELQFAFPGLVHPQRRFRKRSLAALLPAGITPDSVVLSAEHSESRLVSFDEARALVHFPENRDELHALELRLSGLR